MNEHDVIAGGPLPSRRRGRKHGRAKVLTAIGVVIALVLVLLGGAWVAFGSRASNVAAGRPVQIGISRGTHSADIAQQLARAGVIRNALVFRIRAHLNGADAKFKAGEYQFSTGMDDDAVIAKLGSGPDIVFYDVPIPEGFTVSQIATRFEKRAGIPASEFEPLATAGASNFVAKHPYLAGAYNGSLEGYLFPATYRIKKGTSAQRVIEMMLDRFDRQIARVDLTAAKEKGLSLAQVVTIGSIIEREAKLEKDRPLVSSVIYNRLAKKMRLQLDSTVLYVAPPGTVDLTKQDLANPSPYNTYRHAGLPPGPIDNPGAVALDAAAHPARSPYLFYVLTGKDGSQTFATNYADFLKAVAKYHKVFGK